MKRKNRLPDAVNCSITKDFTQVPNSLLRNPEISHKAKSILCLLLSNKDGWVSYLSGIKKMSKEGETSIKSGLKELEAHGYLIRIQYRDKKTKQWVGSFWAYTDVPEYFNIKEHIEFLEENGYEIGLKGRENPKVENPLVGFKGTQNHDIQENQEVNDHKDNENPQVENLNVENQSLKILNNKNTNLKGNRKKIETRTKNGENARFYPLDHYPQEWKDSSTFVRALRNYVEYRKEIKRPLTKRGAKQLAKKLKKYSIQTAKKALYRSIENGWTGVFPESIQSNHVKKRSTPINTCGSRAFQDDDDEKIKYPKGEVFDVTKVIKFNEKRNSDEEAA